MAADFAYGMTPRYRIIVTARHYITIDIATFAFLARPASTPFTRLARPPSRTASTGISFSLTPRRRLYARAAQMPLLALTLFSMALRFIKDKRKAFA